MKKAFINKEQAEEIIRQYPTPFHIYEEKGIRENAKKVKEAFSWNKGFREYFAVKATPNPFILKIFKDFGFDCDCSSLAELKLAKAAGFSDEEIMFSTYFCHPSMADNECSGPSLAAELINTIAAMPKRKYTYRFVFVPETIGSITYLSQGDHVEYLKKHLKAGFVLSCVGDDNHYSMIHTRYSDTLADRVLLNVLKYKENFIEYDFKKRGSDERQYNAPGVDLPVVCFCRSKFGEFPEYHTSADDMSFVSPEGFQGAFDTMMEVVNILEKNARYRMKVLCEPQLGKRGLYSDISRKGIYDTILIQRDVISYCDGKNDLLDLSERIGVDVPEIIEIIDRLKEHDLVEEV